MQEVEPGVTSRKAKNGGQRMTVESLCCEIIGACEHSVGNFFCQMWAFAVDHRFNNRSFLSMHDPDRP